MERLRKSLILCLVAAIPAAAPPVDTASTDLCFTAGPLTYRLARAAAAPDYRVRIDNEAPDLRIALVDRDDTADFALVDDADATGNACQGLIRTVAIVPAGKPADLTIGILRDTDDVDVTLYVHSARVTHQDAAALFALMRHLDRTDRLAQTAD
jgi:hypothetical protein